MDDRIRFYTLPPGPNREYLIRLGVSGFPTFLFFRDGREMSSLAGNMILMDEVKAHAENLLTAS